MTKTTIGRKGQVVIPKGIRERTGLREGSSVTVDARGEEVVIKRVSPPTKSYVEYFTATYSKKLAKNVDIKAILEEEKYERVRLR